ncbi:NAD(P)-binding protein [bacterium]|nr:NAD(P)-binding protein [bacterium]
MRKELDNLDGSDYDFTIIGTGPAGTTLAINLAKNGKKVLLLEAGGYDYTSESQGIYEGTIEGPYPNISSETRLRFFGGTSGHWGGLVPPSRQN